MTKKIQFGIAKMYQNMNFSFQLPAWLAQIFVAYSMYYSNTLGKKQLFPIKKYRRIKRPAITVPSSLLE